MSRQTTDEIDGAVVIGGLVYVWSHRGVRMLGVLDWWRSISGGATRAIGLRGANAIYLDPSEERDISCPSRQAG
jgi:hypothetical protein